MKTNFKKVSIILIIITVVISTVLLSSCVQGNIVDSTKFIKSVKANEWEKVNGEWGETGQSKDIQCLDDIMNGTLAKSNYAKFWIDFKSDANGYIIKSIIFTIEADADYTMKIKISGETVNDVLAEEIVTLKANVPTKQIFAINYEPSTSITSDKDHMVIRSLKNTTDEADETFATVKWTISEISFTADKK